MNRKMDRRLIEFKYVVIICFCYEFKKGVKQATYSHAHLDANGSSSQAMTMEEYGTIDGDRQDDGESERKERKKESFVL
jgi:hypothetical protein